MPIDWSKYGVGEEKPKGSSSSVSRIDWDKYKTPAVKAPSSIGNEASIESPKKKNILQKVGQALADFPNAFNSSTSFGLTDKVGRLTGQETQEEQEARDSRIGGKIGNIAGYIAPGAAIDQAVVRLGGAALKGLPKVAQGLIRGSVAGTLDAAAQETGDVAFRGREFDPLNVAIGAGAGGVLGAVSPLVGKILQKYRPKKVEPTGDILALPEPRVRGNANKAVTDDIIAPEHQFGLPEGSEATRKSSNVMQETWDDLAAINNEIKVWESRYQKAVNDEYQYLKSSGKQGVTKGNLIRDNAGNVVSRFGRQSNNPQWYRDFFAENGRAPTNKELYALANKRVDEGFTDGTTSFSPWKVQNNYDETMDALTGVRDTVRNELKARGLGITDAELKDSTMSFPPKAAKPKVQEDPSNIGQSVKPLRNADEIPEFMKNKYARKQLDDSSSPPSILNRVAGAVNELGDVVTGGMNSGARFGGQSSQAASPTIGHIVSSTRKEVPSLAGATEKAYIDTVDDLFALKKADDLVSGELGRDLNPSESAHELALQSRGSAQQARQIMNDKLINAQGEEIGDSLKDVLMPIGKKQLREFEDYMLNRHAITRFERGEQVFDKLPDGREWTPDIGREIVKQYDLKYPQFAASAKSMRQFDDQFNQAWRVDTGMLKPEVIRAWKEQNPDYINMNRYFSELEKSGNGFGAKRGLAGQNDPTKKYNSKGSRRKIIRPIESKIRAIDAAVKASNRNRSMQALVKNIEDHPEVFKGIAEIVPDGKGKFNLKDIDLTSPDGIDEMMLRFDDAYENVMRSTRKDLDNIVPVMVDGEPLYIRIHDKNLLEAVTSINGEAFDSATKLANHLTNAWKAMLTGINPVFTLTRSVLRDPVSAFVQSKSTNNPIRFISDLTRGAWEVMRNGDLYKEYKRLGGGFNSPNVGTPKLINRTVRDIVPSDKVMEGIVTRFGDKLLDTLNRIESVPRLGEYKRLTGKSLDDKLNALRESREVAVNFQRKGRKGRVIDAYFPYFNAAIQSIDKLGRSIKDRPGSTLAKIGMSVTAPSVLLYALNADNPDYQKLSENEKDRFLHIPLSNGRFFRYPVPQELIPFTSLPRRILQQVRDKDPKAWNEFGSTLVQNIVPPGLGGSILGAAESGLPGAVVGAGQDTFAGPIFDVAANKTWTGAPIVPGYLEGASRKNQMNERTTSLAKKVATLTGGSPMQLDYLIRQYGGDLGNIGTSLIDKGALKAGTGLAEGIGKRLVVDANLSDSALSDFYDLKEKLDRMYEDYKVTGEVPKGYNDNARKQLDNIARGLSDFSKAMREIDKSSLSDKEKKAQKRELTIMRNKIAREAYKALR